MENRFVARGSALAVLLVVLSLLGGLAALLSVHISELRKETEDILLHGKLETAARDALEQVTAWVRVQRPDGPLGSSEPVKLLRGDTPARLSLSLPDTLTLSASNDVEVSAWLQWCVFDAENIPASESSAFPPAMLSESGGAGFYRQNYAAVEAETMQSRRENYGAWRITVEARFNSDEGNGVKEMRRVCFERVLVLEK